MGNLSIEKVTEDKIALWQWVCQQTFRETFAGQNTQENMDRFLENEFSLEKLLKQVRNAESLIFLVKWKENVAGYLQLNIGNAQTEPMGKNSLEIQRIYVLKAFQGLGIGKFLLDTAYAQALEYGKRKVWLGVWEHNTKAMAFYARQNFTKIGSHTFQLGDDNQTDFILSKTIESKL